MRSSTSASGRSRTRARSLRSTGLKVGFFGTAEPRSNRAPGSTPIAFARRDTRSVEGPSLPRSILLMLSGAIPTASATSAWVRPAWFLRARTRAPIRTGSCVVRAIPGASGFPEAGRRADHITSCDLILTETGATMGAVPTTRSRLLAPALVAAIVAGGCKDKAEPDYKKCVEAEAKGDILAAESTCNGAVAADPNSTSGKAADAKLKEMKSAIGKAKAEKATRDAEEAAKRAAEAAAREEAACASHLWVNLCGPGNPMTQRYESKASCQKMLDDLARSFGANDICTPCVCVN